MDTQATKRAEKMTDPPSGYAERKAFGLDEIRAENERLARFAAEMERIGEL